MATLAAATGPQRGTFQSAAPPPEQKEDLATLAVFGDVVVALMAFEHSHNHLPLLSRQVFVQILVTIATEEAVVAAAGALELLWRRSLAAGATLGGLIMTVLIKVVLISRLVSRLLPLMLPLLLLLSLSQRKHPARVTILCTTLLCRSSLRLSIPIPVSISVSV
jgi:hypothetical protein